MPERRADGYEALVLAGGLGTRLRSVVGDQPKVLAPVRGRPFLAWLLEWLAAAGVARTVLCTGYGARAVEAAMGRVAGGMALDYSVEEAPRGTGGALRDALGCCRSDPLLVVNGDSFCDVDLDALASWHRARPGPGTLVLVEVPDVSRFGAVQVDDEGQVVRFVEKGAAGGPGWVNAGVYVLARALLEELPAGEPSSLEREVFPRWAGRGLAGFRHRGRFIDIGTPESLREADGFFRPPGPSAGSRPRWTPERPRRRA